MSEVGRRKANSMRRGNRNQTRGTSRARNRLQFRVSSSVFCLLSSVFCLLDFPSFAAAADAPTFPRVSGLYFSLLKLFPLLLVYFCWVRTCWWVDQDARQLELPTTTWNPLMLGSGLLGLLVVWILPWFWISFLLFVALYVISSVTYASFRDQHVP